MSRTLQGKLLLAGSLLVALTFVAPMAAASHGLLGIRDDLFRAERDRLDDIVDLQRDIRRLDDRCDDRRDRLLDRDRGFGLGGFGFDRRDINDDLRRLDDQCDRERDRLERQLDLLEDRRIIVRGLGNVRIRSDTFDDLLDIRRDLDRLEDRCDANEDRIRDRIDDARTFNARARALDDLRQLDLQCRIDARELELQEDFLDRTRGFRTIDTRDRIFDVRGIDVRDLDVRDLNARDLDVRDIDIRDLIRGSELSRPLLFR